MGQPEWTPANAVERDMATALERGDGAEYARLLRTATLLVPELPAPGTPEEAQLAELYPAALPSVPVFTSEEALVWAFGDLVRSYQETDFAALLQLWPDQAHQLAVNLGSPIATFLPPGSLDDLAAGRESFAPAEEIGRVVLDEAITRVRHLCLRELAGDAVDPATGPLRDDPPSNPVETALRAAVERGDGQAYLHALLATEWVILPTASPVADPGTIFDDDFPWRVLGGDQAQVIPVFSSPTMLQRTGAGGASYVQVDFLHVLVNWPGEEHFLCVNPGSVMELILPGETVMEVVASMAEQLDQPA